MLNTENAVAVLSENGQHIAPEQAVVLAAGVVAIRADAATLVASGEVAPSGPQAVDYLVGADGAWFTTENGLALISEGAGTAAVGTVRLVARSSLLTATGSASPSGRDGLSTAANAAIATEAGEAILV